MVADTGAVTLARVEGGFAGRFTAMAGPCELLIDTDDRAEASVLLDIVRLEARRIERKFSRYRTGNIVDRINHAGGEPIEVDEETAKLIDYAVACYETSEGLFDITSGVLRRVWTFDGGSRVPEPRVLESVLHRVGWHQVSWADSTIRMPEGMEIDLGGIGKEYAVDRAALRIAERTRAAFLVNFGGDLWASGPRRGNRAWGVGVDDPDRTGEAVLYQIDLTAGGLATSGDARRFVMWEGRRLGHILDPRTGWPVEGAPRSVTVLGRNCLEAGTLSTLAYLRGARAADFLKEQGAQYWIL